MDCKSKLKPTRCSKQQTWLNPPLHHPTNAGIIATAKPKATASRTHFYHGAHLRTKQLRACCAQLPESPFDHSSSWWFSSNRVTWPGNWAHLKRHVKSPNGLFCVLNCAELLCCMLLGLIWDSWLLLLLRVFLVCVVYLVLLRGLIYLTVPRPP